MPDVRYRPFQAEIAGRRYSGTWHVEGKILHVSSAYGSDKATLRVGADETAVARRVLAKIVGAGRR
ncbi:MAG: hypothetical protein DI570_22275 [Phenylobacterium zucineum]|nr:MAG: hypothetical protein DI570_22275 [Phenylobacterium zucineum]